MNEREDLGELDRRIATIRNIINELVEQAAACSGAANEERIANRIADLEDKLDALLKKRDALAGQPRQK
jgi:hypothetical protein